MFKKISISLLIIIILLTTGFFIYRYFNNKKVEGVQDINSKNISTPKDSENKTQISNSPSQPLNQNNSISKDNNQNNITDTEQSDSQSPNRTDNNSSDNINSSIPDYATPNYQDTNNDFLIKQAEEEEAQRAAEERRKNDEACRPILATREQLLAPLNAQFNEITRQMNEFEAETNARTDINNVQ